MSRSRMFMMCLCTLLLGGTGCKKDPPAQPADESAGGAASGGVNISAGGTTVKLGPGGVQVKTAGGEQVNVGQGGVQAKTAGGEQVDVNKDGVKVKAGADEAEVQGDKVKAKAAGGTEVNVGAGGVNVKVPGVNVKGSADGE